MPSASAGPVGAQLATGEPLPASCCAECNYDWSKQVWACADSCRHLSNTVGDLTGPAESIAQPKPTDISRLWALRLHQLLQSALPGFTADGALPDSAVAIDSGLCHIISI